MAWINLNSFYSYGWQRWLSFVSLFCWSIINRIQSFFSSFSGQIHQHRHCRYMEKKCKENKIKIKIENMKTDIFLTMFFFIYVCCLCEFVYVIFFVCLFVYLPIFFYNVSSVNKKKQTLTVYFSFSVGGHVDEWNIFYCLIISFIKCVQ